MGDGDVALSIRTTGGTEVEQYVSNFTFRVLHGVSHRVQQEAAGKVNTMIAAWLAGTTVPEYEEIAASAQYDRF